MSPTDLSAERDALLTSFVARLREFEAELGVTEGFIDAASAEAAATIANRQDLFGLQAFPPPQEEGRIKLHELSMGEDDRFGVYLTVSAGGVRAKPHDHQTWQLQVAIEGSEHHRLYRRTDDRSEPWAKLEEVGRVELQAGQARGLLPDMIHAIEIPEGQPSAQMLVCGTGMHRLEGRLMYNPKNGLATPMAPLNRRS